jgi:DNA-binding winged helix-turn-helix (wHTH) protein
MGASGSTTAFLRRFSPPALTKFHPESELDQTRAGQGPDTNKQSLDERTAPDEAASAEVSFGRFRLIPTQFLLVEGEEPVPLGSRALEILIVLVERPGQVVTRQELMARVWPDVFVEPCNLTVHISALRRALRDGRAGNRFIINIPGRGYSFVSPVQVSVRTNIARDTERSARARPLLTCVE